MRVGAIFREAWRDVVSGTAHVVLLALVLTIVTAGLVTADLLTVRGLEDEAVAYQASGASVVTLTAQGRVDPVACDKLASIPGVRSAGAMREHPNNLGAAALPSSTIPAYDVTTHFPLLATSANAAAGGVVVSDQVADALSLREGATMMTRQGSVLIAGVYAYPSDGRRPGLGYAALIPSAETTAFDECWVEAWPVPSDVPTLLRLTVLSASGDTQSPVLSQLNTTLGAQFDGAARFHQRVTRFAPIAGLLLGASLGFLAVRVRRVQHASALHAGLNKADLGIMLLVETLAWAMPAAIIAGAVTTLLAMPSAGADQWANLRCGATICLGGFLGPFVGNALGLALTRQKHLFRYFKTR